jgi:hypothetical protein
VWDTRRSCTGVGCCSPAVDWGWMHGTWVAAGTTDATIAPPPPLPTTCLCIGNKSEDGVRCQTHEKNGYTRAAEGLPEWQTEATGTGYNHGGGNRRASRNGRLSSSPTETSRFATFSSLDASRL